MKIILKYLIRNIIRNKFRTFLILLSIILSTALLFSTLSISKTARQLYLDQMYKRIGSAEVVVHRNESFTTPFFSSKDVSHLNNLIEYQVNATNTEGTFDDNGENIKVHMLGLSLSELDVIHKPTFINKSNDEFRDKKIIIGEKVATMYNLNVGDTFPLYLNNKEHQFIVYGISEEKGFFEYDKNIIYAVVPTDVISSIYESNGFYNAIFFKTKDTIDSSLLISKLFDIYQGYTVRSTVRIDQIENNLSQVTIPFSLMLVLVVFISIFIINTSFKVIILERIPVVGTFRSIGATKRKTNIILLGESLIFGIIGGLIGLLLGFIILYGMINNLSKTLFLDWASFDGTFSYTFFDLVLSLLAAIVISIFGSLLPVKKVSKIPIKDILLNNIKKPQRKNTFKAIIGLDLIILSLLTIKFYKGYPTIVIGAVLMVFVVIGVIFLIPLLTRGFVYVFSRLNQKLFGNIGKLAVINIKNSKNLINNITLLVIGLASLLMINVVSTSSVIEIGRIFEDAKYELVFSHPFMNDEVLSRISDLKDVEGIYPYYKSEDVRYIEGSDSIGNLSGVNLEEYLIFWNLDFVGDKDEILRTFKEERNIILTLSLKNSFRLDVGDYMTFIMNNKEVKYKVIGFVDTLNDDGNLGYVYKDFLQADMNLSLYKEVLIKSNNEEEAINSIKDEFNREIYELYSINEHEKEIKEGNRKTFGLFKAFSIITMIIGSFGVFNNFLVSYLNRKRSIALYRSIGMSKKQTIMMMSIEALNTGVFGGIIAIIVSFSFIYLAEFVLNAMSLPIPIVLDWKLFVYAFFASILISIISNISLMFKSSKLNLVQEIKYE